MNFFLTIICIAGTVYGETLHLSKAGGMKLRKASLDASNISDYFLELLGVKVNPKTWSVGVEGPFGYASILVVVEGSGCLPPSVAISQKIKDVVDWDDVEDSLKVALNQSLHINSAFYESPQKNELGKLDVVSLQKDLEEIKKEIRSAYGSKTVVWIETSQKQSCKVIQDFMAALKKDTDKVVAGFVSKEDVTVRRKRTLLQVDDQVQPVIFGTSRDYPVMFTMIAVVVLIFFLSIIVISYGIAKMDPGRDSIIYRMTSQRMKKEQ